MRIVIFIVLLGLIPTTYAGELQRLFTTAEERKKLDELVQDPTPTNEREPPRQITLNGLIMRNQKLFDIWINGSNQIDYQGFTIRSDKIVGASVPIAISKTKHDVILQPGQTVNILDGEVEKSEGNTPTVTVTRTMR